MRNDLPADGPRLRESAVVNLDDKNGPGTHWVAYRKRGTDVSYFDSFGDLQPPLELMLYLGVNYVKYNYERYQEFDTYNCGHLCLKFLLIISIAYVSIPLSMILGFAEDYRKIVVNAKHELILTRSRNDINAVEQTAVDNAFEDFKFELTRIE